MNIPVTEIVYLQKLRDESTKFRINLKRNFKAVTKKYLPTNIESKFLRKYGINLKKTLRQFKLLFCDEYAGFRNCFNYKRLQMKEQSLR